VPDPWLDVTISDNQGAVHRVQANRARRTASGWSFDAILTPPPSPTARWLTLEGPDGQTARLTVPSIRPPDPTITPTPLSAGEWYLLCRSVEAGANRVRQGADVSLSMPRAAIDALVAVGALELSSPVLQPLEKDARFASAIARSTITSGRSGVWAVGTVADLGTVAVRIEACVADSGSLVVQATVAGWWSRRGHFAELPFAVTAEDDRGGWYLGHQFSRTGGSDDGAELALLLAPHLDPAARTLRVTLTARDAEATFVIPLT
jgi:hypothetical protein